MRQKKSTQRPAHTNGKNGQPAVAPSNSGSTTTQLSVDWKQHPLYVAAASCAATLLICVGVVKEIVLPTYLRGIENDANELKRLRALETQTIVALKDKHAREIAEIREANKAASEKLEKRKQSVETQLLKETQTRAKYESDLSKIGLKDLFQDKNPYPLIFQRVKLKDKFSSVREKYSDLGIKYSDEGKSVVFRLNHRIFSELSFYPGRKRDNDADLVGNIVFTPASQVVARELSETLKVVLGKPSKETTNWISWTTLATHAVYLNRGERPLYFIMPAGSYPLLLDED